VKVSVACDAVISKLCESRKASLAMLGTPTDCYIVPESSRRAAQINNSWTTLSNIPLIPLRIIAGVLGLNVYVCMNTDALYRATYGTLTHLISGALNWVNTFQNGYPIRLMATRVNLITTHQQAG